jgi:hypothetical protein
MAVLFLGILSLLSGSSFGGSIAQYGKCTSAVEKFVRESSHWCAFGSLGAWPSWPTERAKKVLKFARATVYRGPVYGSSSSARTACNTRHVGTDEAALIAVSTKYLRTYHGGWASDKGSCGKCLCIRMHGVDSAYNPGFQPRRVRAHIGLTFKGIVGDRCAECEDEHLDIFQDRPFSFAPYSPSLSTSVSEDKWAPWVNAQDGVRGFAERKNVWDSDAENVGTWVVDWQFVPCNHTHATCTSFMKSSGYNVSYAPRKTRGVDSFTLGNVTNLSKFSCPWGDCRLL